MAQINSFFFLKNNLTIQLRFNVSDNPWTCLLTLSLHRSTHVNRVRIILIHARHLHTWSNARGRQLWRHSLVIDLRQMIRMQANRIPSISQMILSFAFSIPSFINIFIDLKIFFLIPFFYYYEQKRIFRSNFSYKFVTKLFTRFKFY